MTRCLVRAGVLVMKAEQPYLDVATPDDGLASLAADARRTHRELRWGEL